MNGLITELRRRNVFRVAAVYGVVGWVLAQVAAIVFPTFEAPEWVLKSVIVMLLAGFPIAVIFAWAFEMTPDGVKRTSRVNPGESITGRTGRRLDFVLLAGLLLVAAIIIGDRVMPRGAHIPSATASAGGVNLGDKSIAVLPFADLSPAGDQEYFADGLSEELLNVLAQIEGIQVAGRTSSFAFKGDTRDLREIGDILNVAHILEGSVRKSGDQIRVTAQLINAENGYHVFSDTYEGSISDIFEVQDEIAGKITAALRTEWLGEEAVEENAPSDVLAFDLYLKAKQLIYTRDKDNLEEAERLLDRALRVDPAYAPALAQKAIANMLLSDNPGAYGDRPIAQASARSLALAERAVAIDPALGEAHAARGYALSYGNNVEEEEASLRRAIALNPGLSDAKNWLAITLQDQGRLTEATQVTESIVETDPFYGPAFNNLINRYCYTGEFNKAETLIARTERVSGETTEILMAKAFVANSRGDMATAAKYFERVVEQDFNQSVARADYAVLLINLGEYEKALETALPWQRAPMLAQMGRREESDAILAGLPSPAEAGSFPIFIHMITYYIDRQPEKAVAYIDTHFDSLKDAVAVSSAYDATGWLAFAATAYRDLGREAELEEALALLKEGYATDEEAGASERAVHYNKAMLALLSGDNDLALDHMESGLELGETSNFWLSTPAFDPVRLDPRFQTIEAETHRRMNEAREELGLPNESGM